MQEGFRYVDLTIQNTIERVSDMGNKGASPQRISHSGCWWGARPQPVGVRNFARIPSIVSYVLRQTVLVTRVAGLDSFGGPRGHVAIVLFLCPTILSLSSVVSPICWANLFEMQKPSVR